METSVKLFSFYIAIQIFFLTCPTTVWRTLGQKWGEKTLSFYVFYVSSFKNSTKGTLKKDKRKNIWCEIELGFSFQLPLLNGEQHHHTLRNASAYLCNVTFLDFPLCGQDKLKIRHWKNFINFTNIHRGHWGSFTRGLFQFSIFIY